MRLGHVATLAIVKGLAMAVAVTSLAGGEPFWHQLLLAVISAILTACGVIAAAWITVTHQRGLRNDVRDVKRKVHADKRATDQITQVTGNKDE